MYLIRPELSHQDVVFNVAKACVAAGDPEDSVYGGEVLLQLLRDKGYVEWIKRIRANARAVENGKDEGIEPGHTLLIAEHIRGDEEGRMPEVAGPTTESGDPVIGVVHLRGFDSEGVPGCLVDAASMSLHLLPTQRDITSYMLVIQDVLTHIICSGLPYKHICCRLPEEGCDEVCKSALLRCNFAVDSQSVGGHTYLSADLRVAQQLRSRIQEWK